MLSVIFFAVFSLVFLTIPHPSSHLFCRALLHFLDPDKFRSKDEFVQNYKNLSSFNENEVYVVIDTIYFFPSLLLPQCNLMCLHYFMLACKSSYGIETSHTSKSYQRCGEIITPQD